VQGYMAHNIQEERWRWIKAIINKELMLMNQCKGSTSEQYCQVYIQGSKSFSSSRLNKHVEMSTFRRVC